MASTETTRTGTEARCLRCGRKLTAAGSVARRLGKACAAKVAAATQAADLSAWTPAQVADALQAIEDGAVVPSTRDGVFHVVSTDGTGVHLTAAGWCDCRASEKDKLCYHRCAVVIMTAAQPPAAPAGTLLLSLAA